MTRRDFTPPTPTDAQVAVRILQASRGYEPMPPDELVTEAVTIELCRLASGMAHAIAVLCGSSTETVLARMYAEAADLP